MITHLLPVQHQFGITESTQEGRCPTNIPIRRKVLSELECRVARLTLCQSRLAVKLLAVAQSTHRPSGILYRILGRNQSPCSDISASRKNLHLTQRKAIRFWAGVSIPKLGNSDSDVSVTVIGENKLRPMIPRIGKVGLSLILDDRWLAKCRFVRSLNSKSYWDSKAGCLLKSCWFRWIEVDGFDGHRLSEIELYPLGVVRLTGF